MEYSKLIAQRFSCKKFNGVSVEADKLNTILEAGRLAPTAKNLQEQRLYVLQSPEALAKFDSASPCRYGASTVIVAAFDTENVYVYMDEKHNAGAEDIGIVATHMMLAAENLGVNSCWINRFNPEELAKALDLPANEQVVMALDLGYAADGCKPLPPHTSRKDLAETVKYL